jgi:t-SNARE complex subunit (syntaxin)
MSDDHPNLILALLREIRGELASLRDDVNVLTAIVNRLDNSHSRLLTEIRATHSQVSRHGERLRRLESLSAPDPNPPEMR